MTTTNHPDDELLARFADADPEALGDSALSGHIHGCDRCRDLVDDLRGLSLALRAMPDPGLVPPRPLRILPPVEPRPASLADRVGAVIRGAFAPVMTVGAALALVGVVGTSGIAASFPGAASGPAAQEAAATAEDGQEEGFTAAELLTPTPAAEAPARDAAAGAEGAATEEPDTQAYQVGPMSADETPDPELLERMTQADPRVDSASGDAAAGDRAASAEPATDLAAERPIWPMLIFGGLTLMVAAVVLRWIFAPRAA